MQDHSIIAFYSSADQATKVHDRLLSAGFSREDVRLYRNEGNGTRGFWENVKEMFGGLDAQDRAVYDEADRRGASAVAVTVDDPQSDTALSAITLLQKGQPLDLEKHAAQWESEGWSAKSASSQASTGAASAGIAPSAATPRSGNATAGLAGGTTPASTRSTTTGATSAAASHAAAATGRTGATEAIPVVQEDLHVGKRQLIGGGVRVHSRVTEIPVQKDVTLREEHVNVQRRPVDRPLNEGDRAAAFKDRTIEATAVREEAVVGKTARVVEEVVVNKQADSRTQRVSDTVRRTDVDVQNIEGANAPGATYDDFTKSLVSDSRYSGKDWSSFEPSVRTDFEKRYPNSRWDQAKDSIRREYDRLRQKA